MVYISRDKRSGTRALYFKWTDPGMHLSSETQQAENVGAFLSILEENSVAPDAFRYAFAASNNDELVELAQRIRGQLASGEQAQSRGA
jgi:hypothetical protein